MSTDKKLEDYTWEELLEATSTQESLKEAGRDSGQYTLENNLGIHTEDEELRKEWATLGGEAAIDKLLQWQQENDWNIGKLPKTKEWRENMSKAKIGKVHSEETKQKLSEYNIEKNKSLTKEERVKLYSNNSGKRREYNNRKKVYDLLPNEFTSHDLKNVILSLGYDASMAKVIGKDERFFIRIHKGTNQNNPSIYRKKDLDY